MGQNIDMQNQGQNVTQFVYFSKCSQFLEYIQISIKYLYSSYKIVKNCYNKLWLERWLGDKPFPKQAWRAAFRSPGPM